MHQRRYRRAGGLSGHGAALRTARLHPRDEGVFGVRGSLLVAGVVLVAGLLAGCDSGGTAAPPPTTGAVGTTAPTATASGTTPPGTSVDATSPALLTAIDVATGAARFAADIPGADTFAGTTLDQGAVLGVVGSCRGGGLQAVSVDAETGQVRWSTPLPGTVIGEEALSGDGGVLVLATRDAEGTAPLHLSGVDAGSGQIRWQTDLDAGPEAVVLAAAPVVAVAAPKAGAVDQSELTVLDRTTGTTRWTVPTGPPLALTTVDDSVVLETVDRPRLSVYDGATGALRWERTDVEPSYGPRGGAGVVVDGTTDGGITGFDALSGRPRWRRADLGLPELSWRTTLPAAGLGLFASDAALGRVELVELATGRTRLPLEGTDVGLTPGGIVVLGDASTDVLSLTDGSKLGTLGPPALEAGQASGLPVVDDEGTAYVGRSCPGRS